MSKSRKHKLIDSTDFYRWTKAVDVDDDKDYALLCWCITILQIKIEDYAQRYPSPFLVIRPPAILRGLRMVQYIDDLEKWRNNHPDDLKIIRPIERTRSTDEMIKYIEDSINTLMELIPKV